MGAAHHKWGPSAAGRVVACSGSVAMQEGLPDPTKKKVDADRGHNLHALMESGESPEDLPLKDQQALEFARTIEAMIFEDPNKYPVFAEARVTIYRRNFTPLTFGTPDSHQVIPEKSLLIVADYKFGFLKVPKVELNWQCALYAIGLAQKYGIRYVDFSLIVPASHWHDRYTFDTLALEMALEQYEYYTAKTLEPELELVAGDHCRYCRACVNCPAFARLFDTELPSNRGAVTPENGADRLFASQMAGHFSRLAKQQVLEALEEGMDIDGVYLREKQGNRVCSDKSAMREAVSHTIDGEAFDALLKISVADLEKAFIAEIKTRHNIPDKETGKKRKIPVKEMVAMFDNVAGEQIERLPSSSQPVLKKGK